MVLALIKKLSLRRQTRFELDIVLSVTLIKHFFTFFIAQRPPIGTGPGLNLKTYPNEQIIKESEFSHRI